jgi:hypothetical protein
MRNLSVLDFVCDWVFNFTVCPMKPLYKNVLLVAVFKARSRALQPRLILA